MMITCLFFIIIYAVLPCLCHYSYDKFQIKMQSRNGEHRRVLLKPGNDLTLDVIVTGEDGLPPVVLLPSSMRTSDDFDEVAQRIAYAGYLVLRPQPRGLGASRGSLENLTLHILADDVATTIRILGKSDPAIIVGHAFGHYVARVTALDYPELIRGIIIAAGEQRYQNDSTLVLSLERAADERLSREERLKSLYHAFFAADNDASVWLTGWHRKLRSLYRDAGKVPPKSEWWPLTHTPILDLQAAQDPWRPPQSRNELKNVLGNLVTVQLIDGASHALFPEQSEKVADAIINWMKTLN